MKPATAHELTLLVSGFWYFGELEGTLDSSKFWLLDIHCESQQDLESGKLKADIMEGYLHAALLHGIIFVWPTKMAKDSIELCPGAVEATHQQFALKPDDPNNPNITKAYTTNYARVWHVCYCFMLLVALLNSSSLVPVDMERGCI